MASFCRCDYHICYLFFYLRFHSWHDYLVNTRIFVTYGMFICPALIIEDINIDIVECDLLDNIILYWDQYFILDKPLFFSERSNSLNQIPLLETPIADDADCYGATLTKLKCYPTIYKVLTYPVYVLCCFVCFLWVIMCRLFLLFYYDSIAN